MRNLRRFAVGTMTTIALATATSGCRLSDETVSSLVDLAATTTGSFVEIVVRAAADALLMTDQILVPGTPISEQTH